MFYLTNVSGHPVLLGNGFSAVEAWFNSSGEGGDTKTDFIYVWPSATTNYGGLSL